MKALRNQIDKIKPHFEKGGKFWWLHSSFDAIETFLFVPNHVTTKGAHIRDAKDSKRVMIYVVLAMLPATIFGMWNIGYQHDMALGIYGSSIGARIWLGFLKWFPILVVSYITAFAIEFTFAQLRGHEVNEGAIVTGFLIPLIMPVNIPLWMVAVATAFAIIIGKEVFGGTGMNVLNPALTARVFLFFAYPGKISGAIDASGTAVWINTKGGEWIDTFTGATQLSYAAEGAFNKMASLKEMFIGTIPGSIGETSTLAILIGALFLIITGVGSWRIMLSFFLGGAIMSFILNTFATETNPYMSLGILEQLCLGGFAFGAVFMATDPVTAAQTTKGKYIYGFLAGLMAILIRVLNPAYPEGVMMAILLMNVFAPLIDHYVVESNINKRLKRFKTAGASVS